MKTNIIFLFVITTFQLVAQTLESNLQKYWYYKERLKSDFMVSDPQNRQGTNMPATRRFDKDVEGQNYTYLKWGDAEGHLGMYIAVLATEYKLLKDNEQDYSETLQELKNALNAFERLDKYAEYWWREPHDSIFPDDINGFFIRDDIGSDPDSANYILSHQNSLLDESGITAIESDFINSDDGGHPCEMSKDQVWLILPGLALVEALVDEPNYINQDVLGTNVTFREWARKITYRVITYCQGDTSYYPIFNETCDWYIYNPVTGNKVRRGPDVAETGPVTVEIFGDSYELAISNFGLYYEWPFHFGFAEAGNSITHQLGYSSLHCFNSNTNGTDFREAARFQANYNAYNFHSFGCLISIMEGESPWEGLGNGTEGFTYYEFLRHVMLSQHIYEHLRLIRGLIHGFSDISYSLQNPTKQTYLDLLNSAPDCGPYNFDDDCWPVDDWSSINRLIWPEWLKEENDKHGFYNGLDYMLLHNLFCLTFENFIENVSNENEDSLIQSTDIISSDTIISTEDVEYIADRKVILKPGFHAQAGSQFLAAINPQSDNFNYHKTSWQPNPPCTYDFPCQNKSLVIDTINTDSANYKANNENSMENDFKIYPNPNSGIFIIESKNPESVICSLEISNVFGQEIYNAQPINNSKMQIDLSTQPKGIYFVTIYSGSTYYHKRIVLQ